MKPYPRVEDFVAPVLRVTMPRAGRLHAPPRGGGNKELFPCPRKFK